MAGPIFWDVDTQYDFMRADGKPYVPESESIVPNLENSPTTRMSQAQPIIVDVGNELIQDWESRGVCLITTDEALQTHGGVSVQGFAST